MNVCIRVCTSDVDLEQIGVELQVVIDAWPGLSLFYEDSHVGGGQSKQRVNATERLSGISDTLPLRVATGTGNELLHLPPRHSSILTEEQ